MDNKILEIFIPGPAGRLEAKYYKSKKNTSPIALVLQPHPQYGGTMNNKVVVDTFHTFMDNDFSVCRVNFTIKNCETQKIYTNLNIVIVLSKKIVFILDKYN